MYAYRSITQSRLFDEIVEDLLAIFTERFNTKVVPPVPINIISEKLLGLCCEPYNLNKPKYGIEGGLLKKEKVILINEQCSERSTRYRNRFTIAHEIGHYILPDINDNDPNTAILYGISRRKDLTETVHLREEAANKFAGALLVPRSLLISEARKFSVIDAKAVEKLAETFKVSITAMLIRIQHMNDALEWEQKPINIDWVSLSSLNIRLKYAFCRRNKLTTYKKRKSPIGLFSKQLAFSDSTPIYTDTKQSEIIRAIKSKLAQIGLVDDARGKLPKDVLGRPFIIEFAGTPNSGKDTQIEIIAEYLRDIRGYKVKVIDEGYRDFMVNNNPRYRAYLMIGKLLLNLVEIENNPHGYDVYIINRGIFDNLAFLHFYQSQGYLSKEELVTHATSLQTKKLTCLEDIVFLLKISPDESLRRESNYPGQTIAAIARELDPSIPSSPKNLVNKVGLELLNNCYELAYKKYGNSFVIYRMNGNDAKGIEGVSLDLMKQVHSELPPIKSQKPILLRQFKTKSKNKIREVPQLLLPGL